MLIKMENNKINFPSRKSISMLKAQISLELKLILNYLGILCL